MVSSELFDVIWKGKDVAYQELEDGSVDGPPTTQVEEVATYIMNAV